MTRRTSRTMNLGVVAAGALALAVLAGCGSSGGSADTSGAAQRAAAAPTTCPAESGYSEGSIAFNNALDVPVTLGNGVRCTQWSGDANPSSVNGRSIAAGASATSALRQLSSTCTTWGMTVNAAGTTLGPVGVRLCKVTRGVDGLKERGSIGIESSGDWATSPVALGTVTDSSGATRTVVASGEAARVDDRAPGEYRLTIAYGR